MVYRNPAQVASYIQNSSGHHVSGKQSTFSDKFLTALRVCDPNN